MAELIYKEESYQIIGSCMHVHNELGHGFLEVVYKDALQIEFTFKNIPFEREKIFHVYFNEILLPHHFCADFIVYDKIVLEVKSVSYLTDEHIAQTINYLKVTGCKLGLLVNFGRGRLDYERILL